MLILLCVLFFLLLLVAVLAVVKDLAYRRIRVWRDVDQIEVCFLCESERFVYAHDAAHNSFFVNESDLIGHYFIIDLRLILFIVSGANGSVPLFLNRAFWFIIMSANKNRGRTSIRE